MISCGGGRLAALGCALAVCLQGSWARATETPAPTAPAPPAPRSAPAGSKQIVVFRSDPARSERPMDGFAEAMDEAIAGAGLSGLIPRSRTIGFRLEGHGTIFVGAAGSAWMALDRPAPRVPSSGTPKPTPAPSVRSQDAASEDAASQDAASQDRALTRAEIERLTKRLAEVEAALGSGTPPAAPAAEPSHLAQLLATARLEASLGAIESRVEELETRTGNGPARAPAPDPVATLEQSLVELLLARGRDVAPPEGDLSLVVIVSPLGARPAAADRTGSGPLTIQVSVRASELSGGGDRESIRRRVRIVRSGS